ncbi:trans-aconitate methyltransferase [Streptomyces sp. NPDC056716]|uniref:class I SAM-dependent methyltransferase n=1 Tax=unclassified Streptomyces TaxID=2593676 RepID=UPI0036BE713A
MNDPSTAGTSASAAREAGSGGATAQPGGAPAGGELRGGNPVNAALPGRSRASGTPSEGSGERAEPTTDSDESAPLQGRPSTHAPLPGANTGERPTVRLRDSGPTTAPAPDATPTRTPHPESAPHPHTAPRYAPEWLELREPVDARARSAELLDPLRVRLADPPSRADGLVVHDLGCGTGSMGRWLAPRLDGAQHWILHDRDPYLLHFAAAGAPRSAADGSRVTVETRRGDVARLTPDALAGASLVTASALLDVLTPGEIEALAAACTGAGCPALLTLSVAGRVDLTPADPLDAEITTAFNAHQRRTGLLGPDAITTACEAFSERGATVHIRPSPWQLGPQQAALTAQWLRGWVAAAVEQRPELTRRAENYLAARLTTLTAGQLRATIHHTDLLALPRPTDGTS